MIKIFRPQEIMIATLHLTSMNTTGLSLITSILLCQIRDSIAKFNYAYFAPNLKFIRFFSFHLSIT